MTVIKIFPLASGSKGNCTYVQIGDDWKVLFDCGISRTKISKKLKTFNEDINKIISSLEGTSYYNDFKDNIEIFNKEKSTQIFEKVLDECLLKNLKEISIKNYVHIGPIIRYITSKEYEIINLKIII